MARILILAPNGGASLGKGGGTDLVLKQAVALTRAGNEVVLAGYHAAPIHVLRERSRLCLPDLVIESSEVGASAAALSYQLPVKISAYAALLLPGYSRWLSRVFRRVNPEVIWFHDDIPSCALPLIKGRRVSLYVHYPLAARIAAITPPLVASTGLPERLSDMLLRLARVVCRPNKEDLESLHVNSSITQRVVAKSWGLRGKIVHTYVPPHDIAVPDTFRALSVGTISRGKNYEMLLEGWQAVVGSGDLPTGAELRIVGFARDRSYLSHLKTRIRALRIESTTSLSVNASAADLERWFKEATLIAHPAVFEPFGLSLLEGMARGLIPLVFESEWAGGWTDITERGRWGAGFHDADSFQSAVLSLLDNERTLSYSAWNRSKYFSEARFEATYAS